LTRTVLWTFYVGHSVDGAAASSACHAYARNCGLFTGAIPLNQQEGFIIFLALAVPCLLGAVFGPPLVAAELSSHTNRLAWTQAVSRTRWLTTKWLVVALPLLVMATVLTIDSQWRISNTPVYVTVAGSYGRIQPLAFDVIGIVPIAYALFAFALGAALGAIIRRTSWAVVGTVVAYLGITILMVFVIRPSLVPRSFSADVVTSTPNGYSAVQGREVLGRDSWVVSYGYRFVPGTHVQSGSLSANAVGQHCLTSGLYSGQSTAQPKPGAMTYTRCLAFHDIQQGTYYEPAHNFWALQWREFAIYFGASVVLFAFTLLSVRRWRA
jgi:hypothetical protein